jgi:protein SCO1/2
MTRFLTAALAALAALAAQPASAQVRTPPGKLLERVGFDQRLGAQVPLDLAFRDESGRSIPLREFFGQRPVILAPVYYNCPMLCTQTLNGLTRGLKPLTPSIGTDFEVIALSIDPSETPELARRKKAAYLRRYDRQGAERGYHFLTGDAGAIAELTRAIGFRYTYNPQTRQFAHAAGVVVLTPQGRIARYFYGVDYSPRDLQFGLMEASAGRIGTALAWLPLLCYDYDAATGKYTLAILRLTRILGTATALGLAALVLVLLRRERRWRASAVPGAPAPSAP